MYCRLLVKLLLINLFFYTANFTIIQKTKKIDCSLKLPVKTRWSSIIICLESVMKNKNVLQQLCVSEDLNVSNMFIHVKCNKYFNFHIIYFIDYSVSV